MLTVAQTAEALNISESKLRKMIALGEVAPVRVGSRILFSAEYLQKTFDLKQEPVIDMNYIVDQVISRIAGIELNGGVRILFNELK
jgi:excisionase family DNA binding protein